MKLIVSVFTLKTPLLKSILMIKMVLFLLIASCIQVQAAGQTVSLSKKDAPLNEIFRSIEKQSGYLFIYEAGLIKSDMKATINIQNAEIDRVMNECLKGTYLDYSIVGNNILLKKSVSKSNLPQAPAKVEQEVLLNKTITGNVKDESGNPLEGVSVFVKSNEKIGTTTNKEGKYNIYVRSDAKVLVFSMVGFSVIEREIRKDTVLNVVLKLEAGGMDEVVITAGYFDRTRASVTGSQVRVTGDELRKVGSLNFMQAVNAFDPSIRMNPNIEFGSDPNKVPDITIRGENGFDLRSSADDSRSNPNAPLYLLDGIEVSPTRIYDLDMNRIESFVILKDASATSLYGSRGANGVILITTIPPKQGAIKVSVNANTTISIPDLRDYNLMDAKEKLDYERLAGLYTSRTSNREEQILLDIKYNDRLSEVMRGVNTYWLSKPLQTSINQRYNTFLEGGDKSFRYGINLNYDSDKGVLMGSGRERYGINVSFNYNVGKNFLIRNDVTVNNVEGSNSPYGSFSTYAQQNPIERIYDKTTGEMIRTFPFNSAVNPLVNANLPNSDINKYTEFQDNFNMDWRISGNFRVTGRASLTKKISKSEKYLSPLSSVFDREIDANKRGSYTNSDLNSMNFDGNVTASYNNVFAEKITTNIGIGTNVATTSSIGEGYTATGFLSDNMRFVQFAQQFKENSKPSGNFDKSRMMGFFANANIGYENKYYLDLSFRTDGSSRFGKESRFAPFWSVGAAWNVNKEKWWNNDGTLKVRASTGSTGSVNFSADQAITKYQYNSAYEYNDVYGAQLLGYGNPALKWQNTIQNNIGLDLTLWRNTVVLNIDGYIKNTQNLLLPIDVAPSTGFLSYTENLGSMENRGVDMRMRFNIIQGMNDGLSWNVTVGAATNRNKIKNLSNALEALNEEANSKESVTGPEPLRTYQAGRSQSALMVVESLGIDPGTGNEIFKKLNGDLTFEYDPRDKIIVGDLKPTWMGTFQSNLFYKGFNLYAIVAYEYGAKIYNSTLAQKVEGSSPYFNADRRVLYDRWKAPGDITLFKRIDDTAPPYQTTRLVQDNNFIRLQTLSLSYEVPKNFMEKARIERAKLILSTSDLFRISTVKIERGTSYPFAKTFSLALNLTF